MPVWARCVAVFAFLLVSGCVTGGVIASREPALQRAAVVYDTAVEPLGFRDDAQAIADLRAAGVDPSALPCNNRVGWVPGLYSLAQRTAAEVTAGWGGEPDRAREKAATGVILNQMVRLLYEQLRAQNFGAMRLKGYSWRDERGGERPLLVYRSSVLTDAEEPGSCFRHLLDEGRVRHVVNLYGGTLPLDDYLREEERAARRLGATHDGASDPGHWRELIETAESYAQNRERAMREVAQLIRARVLRASAGDLRGNVYLHCAGGMHRSGMVFGILRRCLNRDPMSLIETEYKRHTGYRSPSEAGGFEPLNLRFIEEFDCALLRGPDPVPLDPPVPQDPQE